MPFQLSRGRLKLLTGATATAFVLGLVFLGACWVTRDLRWGHTATVTMTIALALNQRRLAGQQQRRTNEVIDFYAGRPSPPADQQPGDAP